MKAKQPNRCADCNKPTDGNCTCRRERKHSGDPPDPKDRRFIDDLSRVGRMMNVWPKLFNRFQQCNRWSWEISRARKDGEIRRTIENDQRFSCLRDPEGPTTDAEWTLLAFAAMESIGKPPVEGELNRVDGLWVGIPQDHPYLLKRHEGCEWCAKGYKPSPMTSMPMAHVGPMVAPPPGMLKQPTFSGTKYS